MPQAPPSFQPLKDRLQHLYGIAFPDNLFLLHEFLRSYEPGEREQALGALGISPTGPLQVLDRIADGRNVSTTMPIVLHYRFYRDPPEFFTCLHGDTDGLHWGLLWDEPTLGFRGCASYYSNDGDTIQVYRGLFDAVLDRIHDRLESADEMIEDDPEYEEDWRKIKEVTSRTKSRLLEFAGRSGVRWNDNRPSGLESDTGLDLIVGEQFLGDRADETPQPRNHWQALSADGVNALLSQCKRGRVVPAMRAGRSLWHWGGGEHSDAAYRLLRAAYAAVERPDLIRVLDVHYRHRDVATVDVLAK